MDVERWRRVEDIYHEVVSGPDESREAALNRCCAGDPELRQEVESLLSARDDAGDFLSPENLHAPIAPPGPQPAALAGGRLDRRI